MRVLIVPIAALLASGCDGDSITPRNDIPREQIVLQQCVEVQLAAARFHDRENRWPSSLADTTAAGETLVEFLPGGLLLENAWTGERTEPRPDDAPAEPGLIRYAPLGWNGAGYRISGYGMDSLVARLDNIEDLTARTIENAGIVRNAVELFAAANGGAYPTDPGVDCTPGGDTVIDLLPGGVLLVNAFTGFATEPVSACAALPGEVGYVPIIEGGASCGYVITCCGEHGAIIQTISRPCDGVSFK